MTVTKAPKKLLSILLSLVMLISAVISIPAVEAYAASLAKPVVTLTNTAPTTIKVSWKKVSGASKYTVYRSTKKNSGYKAIKTTTSTSYSSTGLTCGKIYYFKVKAISGSKTAISSIVYKRAVPAKVSGLKASATCSTVKLSWTKASNVSGYQIYYTTSKTGTYKKLTSTTANSFTVKKLSAGATRYYKVRAYKKVGSKYYYGAFSSVVYKKTAHSPSTSWTMTKKPTCAQTGVRTNICSYCGKKYSEVVAKDTTAHSYTAKKMPADKVYEEYTLYTCTICGEQYESKKKKHEYSSVVTPATCSSRGYTTYTCKNCNESYVADYTEPAPHAAYREEYKAPNCTEEGYTYNVCVDCGYIDESSKHDFVPATGTDHNYVSKTVEPTCTTDGYTANVCTICGNIDTATITDTVAALGHDYPAEYSTDENGFRSYTCTRCEGIKTDYTCYIDLTNETVSVPSAAVFGKSSTNSTEINDKLDLTPTDLTVSYEIIGEAENLTIDVNADRDVEVRLNGVTITNDSMDCIDIKNKSTAVDTLGNAITPEVSVSAVSGSENFLTATTSGNAIENNCELTLKGHGSLTVRTSSTSISSEGKINIKNINLNITSSNRGIDTRSIVTTDVNGIATTTTSFYNIKIGANATITITSADDCIRCKNMEIYALEAGTDDVDTVMVLNSTLGDGIQLEGNTGITALSGNITIRAGKYAFNCSAALINVAAATVDATGNTAYSKP
ncbi:MAG: carbohydrate-binding domain-containing protein [Eubacterium sp.]